VSIESNTGAADDCDDDVMFSSSSSAAGKGLKLTSAMRGVQFLDWQDQQHALVNDKVINARASGKPTPEVTDMISIIETGITKPSAAHDIFVELRKATNKRTVIAAGGGFSPCQPTQAELQVALHLNMHDPNYVADLSADMRKEFEQVEDAAAHKGKLVRIEDAGLDAPAAQRSASTELQIYVDGIAYTPNLYAYKVFLFLFARRFAQATEQQEMEFSLLTQGDMTEDAFAAELQRQAAGLRHRRDIDEKFMAMRFVNGLSDSELQASLRVYMQQAEQLPTITALLVQSERYRHHRRAQTKAQLETDTARACMAGSHAAGSSSGPGSAATSGLNRSSAGGSSTSHGAGSASGSSTQSSATAKAKAEKRALFQGARAYADSLHLPKDHAIAPCMLRGHEGHLNGECKNPANPCHPANRAGSSSGSSVSSFPGSAFGGYGQPPPPPGATLQPSYGLPQSSFVPHTSLVPPDPYMSAGAATSALPPPFGQSRGMGQQSQRWWQQPGAADKTNRFMQGAGRGQQRQGQQQRGTGGQRCGVCGFSGGHSTAECFYANPHIAPEHWQPSSHASANAYQTYLQACGSKGMHPKPLYEPGQARPQPAGAAIYGGLQQQPAAAPLDSCGQDYCLGGALVPGPEPHSFFVPAAAAARGRQPHGFWPDEPALPRPAEAAGGSSSSSNGSINRRLTPSVLPGAAGNLQVQLSFSVAPGALPRLLSMSQPAGEGAKPLLDDQAAVIAAALAQSGEPSLAQQLQSCLSSEAMDLQAYKNECAAQHLYTFSSVSPEQGVTLVLADGREILVPRATQDGGCIPNIMSEEFAKAIGLPYKPFDSQSEPRVRTIEGAPTTHIVGSTAPINVALAKGAAGEVVLRASTGFLVVRGAAAAQMYDVVLGRELLAPVSGFVLPVARAFCYMPRLPQNDLTMHSLPITVGRARTPAYMADVAAASAAPFRYICSLVPDAGDDAGGQAAASSSCSSAPVPEQAPAADATASAAAEVTSEPVTQQPTSSQQQAGGWGRYDSLILLLCALPLLWRCNSLTLLLCALPMLFLTAGRIASGIKRACEAICAAALMCRPHQKQGEGKIYYRLGRYHRASDGDQIKLQCAPGSSGHKPKQVEVLQRQYTRGFVLTALPARALLLILMLITCTVSSTLAMQAAEYSSSNTLTSRSALGLPLSLPFSPSSALAMGLASGQPPDECFRW
jgi:hypothetical protein